MGEASLEYSLIKHTCSWRDNLQYYEHWTDKKKYFYVYLDVWLGSEDVTGVDYNLIFEREKLSKQRSNNIFLNFNFRLLLIYQTSESINDTSFPVFIVMY